MDAKENITLSTTNLTSIRSGQIIDKSEIQDPQKLITVIGAIAEMGLDKPFGEFAENLSWSRREPFFLAHRNHVQSFGHGAVSVNQSQPVPSPIVSIYISPKSFIERNATFCIDVSEDPGANLNRAMGRVERDRIERVTGNFGNPGFQLYGNYGSGMGFQPQVPFSNHTPHQQFDKLLDVLSILLGLEYEKPNSNFGF